MAPPFESGPRVTDALPAVFRRIPVHLRLRAVAPMNTPRHLRIATRASALALWQSEHVAARLRALYPNLAVELVPMTTTGDRIIDRPLAAIGGKGLFIKELELAMAAGSADIAVHSMKDVPAELPAGFEIGAVLEREDPRDVLVAAGIDGIDGCRTGDGRTSSLRRRSQPLARRPTVVVDRAATSDAPGAFARGRIHRDRACGRGPPPRSARTHLADLAPTRWCSCGTGAIGIECRAADGPIPIIAALAPADLACVTAERAMNACSAELPCHRRTRPTRRRHLRLTAWSPRSTARTVRQTASGPFARRRSGAVSVKRCWPRVPRASSPARTRVERQRQRDAAT